MEQNTGDRAGRIVGTGVYLGLIILFLIPVVGFIACIAFSFAPQNRNIRHFSQAALIWMVVGLLILALLAFAMVTALSMVSDMLLEELNRATDGEITSYRDIARYWEVLEDKVEDYGGLEKLAADLEELGAMADELGGWDQLLEKLNTLAQSDISAEELNGLLEQTDVSTEELNGLLDQLQGMN